MLLKKIKKMTTLETRKFKTIHESCDEHNHICE